MIKPNELRIGNLFHQVIKINGIMIPQTNSYLRVGSIDKFGTVQVIEPENEETFTFKYKYHTGIPLTEEWLLKFGFEETSRKPNYISYHYISKMIYFPVSIGEFEYWYYLQTGTRIDFVHQLQNLFFVVTGKELIIKKEVYAS